MSLKIAPKWRLPCRAVVLTTIINPRLWKHHYLVDFRQKDNWVRHTKIRLRVSTVKLENKYFLTIMNVLNFLEWSLLKNKMFHIGLKHLSPAGKSCVALTHPTTNACRPACADFWLNILCHCSRHQILKRLG